MRVDRSLMGVSGMGLGESAPYMPARPPVSAGSVGVTLWCYTAGYWTDACKVERSLDQDSDAKNFGIQLPPPPKPPALDPLTNDYEKVQAQAQLDYEKQLADWAKKSIENSQIGTGSDWNFSLPSFPNPFENVTLLYWIGGALFVLGVYAVIKSES